LQSYKESTSIKEESAIRAVGRVMKKYNKLLIRKDDLEITESIISESIAIYKKKLNCYGKRQKFRQTNRKFELYRNKFYLDVEEENRNQKSNVLKEEVIKFWDTMWNKEEIDNTSKYADFLTSIFHLEEKMKRIS